MQPYRLSTGFLSSPSSVSTAVPTFREQGEAMLSELSARKRKPVHWSTIRTWRHNLEHWLYPTLGHLRLSEITHTTIRSVIVAMADAGLKPSSIDARFRLITRVLASCLDENGEAPYARRWNLDFLDLPVIDPRGINRPSFSEDIVSGLARWRFPREQMMFILAAASGARIGELLGLEIRQHISNDCSTLRIDRQVYRGRILPYPKTDASYREIDLYLDVANLLRRFIGNRASGLLFVTGNDTPINSAHVYCTHLHPALSELGFVNELTGTDKAGMHAFRRFRNTQLGKCNGLPERLHKYWMGHSARTVTDQYDKSIEDREFRMSWAQRCGIGFRLPLD